jgi:hypothetical protein
LKQTHIHRNFDACAEATDYRSETVERETVEDGVASPGEVACCNAGSSVGVANDQLLAARHFYDFGCEDSFELLNIWARMAKVVEDIPAFPDELDLFAFSSEQLLQFLQMGVDQFDLMGRGLDYCVDFIWNA